VPRRPEETSSNSRLALPTFRMRKRLRQKFALGDDMHFSPSVKKARGATVRGRPVPEEFQWQLRRFWRGGDWKYSRRSGGSVGGGCCGGGGGVKLKILGRYSCIRLAGPFSLRVELGVFDGAQRRILGTGAGIGSHNGPSPVEIKKPDNAASLEVRRARQLFLLLHVPSGNKF